VTNKKCVIDMSLILNNNIEFASLLHDIDALQHRGKVVQAYGTTVRVSGLKARIGQQCLISGENSNEELYADVVGIVDRQAILLPLGNLIGISQEAQVTIVNEEPVIKFSEDLLGKVNDGTGRPLDNNKRLNNTVDVPIYRNAPYPLKRKSVSVPFCTGVRAIDSILTMGIGQRAGIFSPAGVGKSSLLSMIAKNATTDVVVIALIGERGREVKEFLEYILKDTGLERSVVVVATSDRPAMERLRAAYTATTIAEKFRDQGKNVLLLMDSITRLTRAQREIGLSIGEPPVRRGFPPSVFAELPRLFERVGNNDKGSITAFYTVLVEGDEGNDPIAEEVRSLLDGHITLTRKLAQENHYPAIDILKSVSRLVEQVTTKKHQQDITHFRRLLAKYNEIEYLLQIGEYEKGADALADEAISKIEHIKSYLIQYFDENVIIEESISLLSKVIHE
jgi:type III secretion protein N (ATPase)